MHSTQPELSARATTWHRKRRIDTRTRWPTEQSAAAGPQPCLRKDQAVDNPADHRGEVSK